MRSAKEFGELRFGIRRAPCRRAALAALSLLGLSELAITGCGSSRSASASVVATPVISPSDGNYSAAVSVAIADATIGATIYYTTDGSAPTPASAPYTKPITVSSTATVSAIAVENGYLSSAVATAKFVLASTTATPTISPAGGAYDAPQSVTLADATAGAAIYYTTDGSTPTPASPQYSAPIVVAATTTINAIAQAPNDSVSGGATAQFVIQLPAATPVITPPTGTYTSPQTVAITDATAGATIYYTLDGSQPTGSSSVYSGAIPVAATQIVTAIATAPGYSASAPAQASIVIAPPAAAPVIAPAAGTYTSAQNVSIADATGGAAIYYTTDGSAPTQASQKYSGPFSVGATETVQAIAFAPNFSASPVASASYTINLPAATPVFSPAGGTFNTPQTVTISDSSTGATIYYTTDGSAPTTASPQYSGPLTVSTNETVKAIANAPGSSASAVGSAEFFIAAATPAFAPVAGTYTSAQSVSISDATPGATIYYTANGSAPTQASTKYVGPISVGATETIQAIAFAPNYNASPVASAAYTIHLPAATPVITPVSGTYTATQSATITDTTAGATIYYTTDGSAPSQTSTKYAGPISVGATETIQAIAFAPGSSGSPVASATYTIHLPADTPVFSPPGGSYANPQTVSISSGTAGATIYYTTDGSAPTTASKQYSGPVTVSASETLQAIADAPGSSSSAVGSAHYVIALPAAAAPTFSPAAGAYPAPQSVTLATASTGAAIYYTLDGSAPTTGSAKYSAPISVSQSETIKAIASGGAFSESPVATGPFVILKSSLSGTVMAGPKPVSGSTVQIYAAGSSGYASAATALDPLSVVTDSHGRFTVNYNCPSSSTQVYLIASGGNPGLAAGTNNNSLALMSGLGSCGGLGSLGTAIVNEATTVASAAALAPFMSSAANVGSSSTNPLGLANAFLAIPNLVEPFSGIVLAMTPASNVVSGAGNFLSGIVPQAEIDTLANLLSGCAATDGTGAGCSALLSNATPVGGTAPSDTLEAALDIVKNPGNNIGGLYAIAPSAGPFQPSLAAAPNDWTIAIQYVYMIGGNTPFPGANALAIDGSGNAWIADLFLHGLVEILPTGSFPANGFNGYPGEGGNLSSPAGPRSTRPPAIFGSEGAT